MVMIEALVGMARYLTSRPDDDVVDRLNYLYTPNILLALSVLISFKQFGGRPLECMFPNKFPGSWEQYAENLCWSESTYFVQHNISVATLSDEERTRPDRQLSYYQWVPFFLLLQAACFRFPSFLWKCISLSSGIRVHEIVQRAKDPANMDEGVKSKNMEILTKHIVNALRFQHRISQRNMLLQKTLKLLNVTYTASYISYIYLFMKGMYFANVWMQLYLMNIFLKTGKHQWYGIGVINDILHGEPWETSGFFPRVSICDFHVRQVANIQKYSVQCVLVINIFNEKIFIFLWFWYVMLLVATVISFFYWAVVIVFPFFGRLFIKQNLELKSQKAIAQFVHEYLKQDGIFVLRMVSLHAGIIFGCDLVVSLYKVYYGLVDKHLQSAPAYYENNKHEALRQRKKNKEHHKMDDEEPLTLLVPIMQDKDTPSDDESDREEEDVQKDEDDQNDKKSVKSAANV
uniref:Innexin n=1 Tax=Acrobeloides nanus TaxID=290746 RepID=A0A914DNE0_9BILA